MPEFATGGIIGAVDPDRDVTLRRWLAGWISRIGGALVQLADRVYSPPRP